MVLPGTGFRSEGVSLLVEQQRWKDAEPLALRIFAIQDSLQDTLARVTAGQLATIYDATGRKERAEPYRARLSPAGSSSSRAEPVPQARSTLGENGARGQSTAVKIAAPDQSDKAPRPHFRRWEDPKARRVELCCYRVAITPHAVRKILPHRSRTAPVRTLLIRTRLRARR
jgi:hypothetical protein